MDEMSKLNFTMNVLQELIGTNKCASKMMEDRMSLLREQMLTSKMREKNMFLLRKQLLAALTRAHQDIKKINSTMIQRYTGMRIQYIALQDEYLALAKCTAGKLKL